MSLNIVIIMNFKISLSLTSIQAINSYAKATELAPN